MLLWKAVRSDSIDDASQEALRITRLKKPGEDGVVEQFPPLVGSNRFDKHLIESVREWVLSASREGSAPE